VRRQIAMLLVVAVEARNAGAETQRWKARSTKMPGGNGGMQREARARVSDGNRDATGKAERRMWFVGIARKMGVCNGRTSGGGGRWCSWRCAERVASTWAGQGRGQATGLREWTWALTTRLWRELTVEQPSTRPGRASRSFYYLTGQGEQGAGPTKRLLPWRTL